MRKITNLINDCVTEYFRCDEEYVRFAVKETSSARRGYFKFGSEAICFGNCKGDPAVTLADPLPDALADIAMTDGIVTLPFDPSEVIRNLHCEEYIADWRQSGKTAVLAQIYYFLRPLLAVGIRRYLQRIHLRGWEKVAFPRWPVDTSVDSLQHELLRVALRNSGVSHIPFIWFWPNGAPSCAIMTHDVETHKGRDFSPTLMDVDDSFGIKASFQVIPEERYTVAPEFLDSIRNRGFEVVVHDLNHDGHLYRDRDEFLQRASKINSYGKIYKADGFRAGVLYRKQLWYDALDFSFDMSVPNVAHLDPQRGGCCTVMPYFIGNILELPVTMIQDYTLFNILNDYSIDIWLRQSEIVMRHNGLMSFIVHPDYVINRREQEIFKQLLAHLTKLRKERGLWIAKPGEVNRWWRQRAAMRLVQDECGWRVEGDGSERACVAYASERDGKICFSVGTGRSAQVGEFIHAQRVDVSANG